MIPGFLKDRRRRRKVLWAAVPVLAAGLALAVRPPGAGRPPRPDETARRVAAGRFRTTVVLTGALTALRSEEFKVPVTETYRVQIKWMVKEGETVKPGDAVVRFDTAGLASSIESAQDALKAKLEEKARKEDDYENQAYELDVEVKKAENDNRQKSLDASIPEGLESKYEYDRKQLEKKISDQAVVSARANRSVRGADLESQIRALSIEAAELQARLDRLRGSLDDLTLVARTEGAVIYRVDDWSGRKVQVGDTVFATSVVATVPDLTSLLVQAWISETHIQRIQAGRDVALALDAYPDRPFAGVIREISKSADPVRRWGRSNYFRVDIAMDKLEPDIMKPGMSVRCEVRGPEYEDVLLVPLDLAAFDGQDFWVRPAGAAPVKLAVLDYDDFTAAAGPRDNPALQAGVVLVPVGPLPKTAEEAKAGETR
jgi:multidrug efflux pump subunit AcrA (membrane-fusion protein)